MGLIIQLPQLRMDECRDGELIAYHHSGYGCGCYVVCVCHSASQAQRNYLYGIVK